MSFAWNVETEREITRCKRDRQCGKDYLQNYFTGVNECCVAIRVLQYSSFQEGCNFLLKCEMRGNSFHERSIFFCQP